MLALAWFREHLQCPKCGNPKSVCSSPEAEFAFAPAPPVRCHLTTAAARARDDYMAAASHGAQTEALTWSAQSA